MTVLLRQSADIPEHGKYEAWLLLPGTDRAVLTSLSTEERLERFATLLDNRFLQIRETWWRIGKALSVQPTADLSRASTTSSFGSDLGLMLAVSEIVKDLAKDEKVVLVLCDDPWLFRHLSPFPGINVGSAPSLAKAKIRLWGRGLVARLWTGSRLLLNTITARFLLKRLKALAGETRHWLLVYGHPDSTSDGLDAYFGDLMVTVSELGRMLHTDCSYHLACKLTRDGRTASLHAWGNIFFAIIAVFAKWRPSAKGQVLSEYGWLVERAAAFENGGGGPVMNKWQAHCQSRWVKQEKPSRVFWPWENHGWEREFCKLAHQRGVETFGFQHTAIGPYHFNYAPHSNVDPSVSLPSKIICNGPACLKELIDWDVPGNKLVIGGSFRVIIEPSDKYDERGPVFIPLSADQNLARLQLSASQRISDAGIKVLVKEHPMYPLEFEEGANLKRSNISLRHQSGVSGVIYSSGFSGVEAILSGLPAFRLVADDRISIDVLPKKLKSLKIEIDDLPQALKQSLPTTDIDVEDIFSPVNKELWESLARPKPNTSRIKRWT